MSWCPCVIRKKQFEEIIYVIKSQEHKRSCLKILSEKFPYITNDTLLSIYSQQYQLYTKQVHHTHRQPVTALEYYEKYQRQNTQPENAALLLQMADEVLLSPTLFARIILEEYVRRNELVPADVAPSSLVSQWIKAPDLIVELTLREQVRQCVLNDANYGPLAENLKHSMGYQYEFLLLEKIKELNIPFLDERALSARGYDKTPDVRLEVPIAVNGHIVNWIESKASFGDEVIHNKYLNEQFWSYTNRFGSGLVIYWFGYTQELDLYQKQGIMLSSSFPSESSQVLLR